MLVKDLKVFNFKSFKGLKTRPGLSHWPVMLMKNNIRETHKRDSDRTDLKPEDLFDIFENYEDL
jgi:hypothetical protein